MRHRWGVAGPTCRHWPSLVVIGGLTCRRCALCVVVGLSLACTHHCWWAHLSSFGTMHHRWVVTWPILVVVGGLIRRHWVAVRAYSSSLEHHRALLVFIGSSLTHKQREAHPSSSSYEPQVRAAANSGGTSWMYHQESRSPESWAPMATTMVRVSS
jgi:hypothetical protein